MSVTVHAVGRDTGARLEMQLCEPRDDETCPITCGVIACPEEEVHDFPHVPAGVRSPLPGWPRLTCAQLPCGHRFQGTVLLVHFLRSTMQCPLCRGGPSERLDPLRSLHGEPWLSDACRSVTLSLTQDANADQQDFEEMLRQDLLHDQPEMIMQVASLEDIPVMAHFLLYSDDQTEYPRVVLPFRLTVAVAPHRSDVVYFLEPSLLRELSRAAQEFESVTMAVDIFGVCGNARVSMAAVEKFPLEMHAAHIEMTADYQTEIRRSAGCFITFTYTPGLMHMMRLLAAFV